MHSIKVTLLIKNQTLHTKIDRCVSNKVFMNLIHRYLVGFFICYV